MVSLSEKAVHCVPI